MPVTVPNGQGLRRLGIGSAWPAGTAPVTGQTFVPTISQPLAAAYGWKKIIAGYNSRLGRVWKAGPSTLDVAIAADGQSADVAAVNTFVAGGAFAHTIWADQSGNGLDISQAVSANMPLMRSRGTALTTTQGINTITRLPLSSSLVLDNQAFSIFLVARQISNCRPQAWYEFGNLSTSYDTSMLSSDFQADFTMKGLYGNNPGTAIVPTTPATFKGQALPGAARSVIAIIGSPSGITIMVDGRAYAGTAFPAGTMTVGGVLAWAHENTGNYKADYEAALFYAGTATAPEALSITDALRIIFGTRAQAPTQNVIMVGDSIFEGFGAVLNLTMASMVSEGVGSETFVRNIALSGSTAQAWSVGGFNPYVATRWQVSGAKTACIHEPGTNDIGIGSTPAATVWSYLQTMATNARAGMVAAGASAGYVIGTTLLPRSDASWDSTKEAIRLTLNQLMRDNTGPSLTYDALIDAATSKVIGYDGTSLTDPARSSNILTLFGDKLHPTDLYMTYWAVMAQQALARVGMTITAGTTPAPLAISFTGSYPSATTNVAYADTARPCYGGLAPYTYTLTSGALPTGLTLDATTGIISGTPTVAGTSPITVTATDTAGTTAVLPGTIVVAVPLAFTNPALLGSWTYSLADKTLVEAASPTSGTVNMNRALSGLQVWAVTIDAGAAANYWCVGIRDGSASSAGPGFEGGGKSLAAITNGAFWNSGALGSCPPSLADGNTIAFFTNHTTKKLWATKDGNNWYGTGSGPYTLAQVNAGTGGLDYSAVVTGSPVYPCVGSQGTASKGYTIVPYPFTLPTGATQL